MTLERLNNLPLNTVTPNFVPIFVFFSRASSFIERISFSEIEAKREAILFLFGWSEVNSTWIITSAGFLLEAGSRVPAPVYFEYPATYSAKLKKKSNKKIINLN